MNRWARIERFKIEQRTGESLFSGMNPLDTPPEYLDFVLTDKEGVANTSVLYHGGRLLLLEEGHCLRQQALDVCALAGAHERTEFRATSMETLRQMVAAGVGVTLMPLLAVKPPMAETGNVVIRPFEEPAPSRTIALAWRSSSALSGFLSKLAGSLKKLPPALLDY